MAVKIRFTRIGKKHAPVYRIVAVDSRKKRDGEYLENLGTYNPLTKTIVQWHEDRIQHWVSVGAILTDSVKRLQKIKNKQTASTVVVEAAAPKAKVVKKAAPAKDKAVKATTAKAAK
jgi:small subunit ribosomal protein S16